MDNIGEYQYKNKKYVYIDEREIKCCDLSPTTVQAGISFDENNDGTPVLNFHFLELIERGILETPLIKQQTKSMWLNKENTNELIKALKGLRFKKPKKK